jgi:hypothetical protein
MKLFCFLTIAGKVTNNLAEAKHRVKVSYIFDIWREAVFIKMKVDNSLVILPWLVNYLG